MHVEECRFHPGNELAWDEYVSRHGHASYCQKSGWARVIQRSYGHSPSYLWALDAGRVQGVLPLVLFRGALGARSLVSLPFLDEGGVCADSQEAKAALWEAAMDLARRHRVRFIELRQRDASGLPLEPAGSKVTVVLDLADTPEDMWKRLDAKVRNQTRKAMNAGLFPAWCGMEGLGEFYEVFAANMRDLGSPVHSRRFFANILGEFSSSTRLLLVKAGPQTVAGAVCVFFQGSVVVPWASSLRQWRSQCPGNLLYWEVIRFGCEKGLQTLDFGRSSPGSGTYRFKMQWGGVEQQLHWGQSGRSGHAGPIDADDPRYAWAVRTWQRLPVSLATRIGPIVRGRLSN
jgi:FemAB-related protein (PEP-CTERM system-associated)